MEISVVYLIGHLGCSVVLVLLMQAWGIDRLWKGIFALLFLISPPAVFLIWGPERFFWLYALAFVSFLLSAKATYQFHLFLKTQEALIRFLFLIGIVILSAGIVLTSVFEINLRRNSLKFWRYQSTRYPNAATFNHLAEAYYLAKDLVKAQEYYQRAIAIDPKFIKPYESMVRLYSDQQDWSRVVIYCQQIIALEPKAVAAYLHLAEAFMALDKKAEAVETYRKLLDRFPDDEKVYVKVIEAYGRAIERDPKDGLYKEKREEVLADFEQLSKRRNYNATDYYNLGFLYEQVGGKEEAMRFYSKAIQKQPDHAQALLNLANLYRDAGNYKVAMDIYSRLVHFHPKQALGYLGMGIILNALGEQQKARQLYLKVVDLDPENGEAYFNLGYLSESQGELREAVNYYEKAAEVAPKNAETYYNLGNVYARLGQNGEAIASYLKTVNINPKHQDAFVNLSILSYKSREFQGAIHYLEQAKALGYNPPAEYIKTLEPYRKRK